MTRDRLATRKWKVPSNISESRSMMRLPSLTKSKSEVFGQSGHCSARLLAAHQAGDYAAFNFQPLPLRHPVGRFR
jgi:hypothetical protein